MAKPPDPVELPLALTHEVQHIKLSRAQPGPACPPELKDQAPAGFDAKAARDHRCRNKRIPGSGPSKDFWLRAHVLII
ncbi:MAG TPA: hypothetical protein VF070_38185 [Streptosporangiaceae bacterium]